MKESIQQHPIKATGAGVIKEMCDYDNTGNNEIS